MLLFCTRVQPAARLPWAHRVCGPLTCHPALLAPISASPAATFRRQCVHEVPSAIFCTTSHGAPHGLLLLRMRRVARRRNPALQHRRAHWELLHRCAPWGFLLLPPQGLRVRLRYLGTRRLRPHPLAYLLRLRRHRPAHLLFRPLCPLHTRLCHPLLHLRPPRRHSRSHLLQARGWLRGWQRLQSLSPRQSALHLQLPRPQLHHQRLHRPLLQRHQSKQCSWLRPPPPLAALSSPCRALCRHVPQPPRAQRLRLQLWSASLTQARQRSSALGARLQLLSALEATRLLPNAPVAHPPPPIGLGAALLRMRRRSVQVLLVAAAVAPRPPPARPPLAMCVLAAACTW